MKKLIGVTLFIFMLILLGGNVDAASFKMTASTSEVSPNGSFTVSVGGDCIGRVNLSVSNGTLSTSSVWVEQGYQTVSVKAGGSGTVTVTATPTVGFSDSDANEYKPGARTVKVTIVNKNNNTQEKPSNQTGTSGTNNNSNKNNNTSNKKPKDEEEKSSNNLLGSLNISTGTIEPNFDANVSEYSIELPKDTKTISINAESQDSKARINGAGEINLNPGENIINITVIAENNDEKVYTIKAYVDEAPDVYLKYKDKEIGVIKNLRGVTIPEGFNEKEHTINDYKIKTFDNEHFTIIYGIDSEENKNFYIIDTEKNECISKITPITIDKHFFYLVDLEEEKEGFEKSFINIDDKEIIGYKFKEGFADYFLLSVINKEGEKVEYLYESKEGTLQLYSGSAPVNYNQYEELIENTNTKQIIIYILATLLMISVISIIILIIKLRKETSK